MKYIIAFLLVLSLFVLGIFTYKRLFIKTEITPKIEMINNYNRDGRHPLPFSDSADFSP